MPSTYRPNACPTRRYGGRFCQPIYTIGTDAVLTQPSAAIRPPAGGWSDMLPNA